MEAVSSRGNGRTTEQLQISKKWKEREWSPERTKVWTQQTPPNKLKSALVPVLYYLSRNGQLDHPHFIEVPLSSPSQGLYLRDVINRLNFLRGKGMASMYSWSSKRSYKSGFVWHDLAENDFIYPAHGQEYVLKGSEIIEANSISSKPSDETVSSSSTKPPPERRNSGEGSDFPAVTRRRNQSWSAIDLQEYKVYTGESAADASTQTDEKRRRRQGIREIEENEREEESKESYQNQSTELSRDEISPPPSDSSPETLESLMKADGRVVLCPTGVNDDDPTANNHPTVQMKASSVLMQLISCGSMSFRDCGPSNGNGNGNGNGNEHDGFSVISHYKARLPRGSGSNRGVIENPRVELEDKEYFSGSLIETKEEEFIPALKRSSSYNAERSSQLEVMEKEKDGATAKCIPRKPKTRSSKKEMMNSDISCNSSQQGSKRIEVQP